MLLPPFQLRVQSHEMRSRLIKAGLLLHAVFLFGTIGYYVLGRGEHSCSTACT